LLFCTNEIAALDAANGLERGFVEMPPIGDPLLCAGVNHLLRLLGAHRQGFSHSTLRCDVSEPDQVEAMVIEAQRRFGHIDTLVNDAGTIQVAPADAWSGGSRR
jgi:NAD(P)-dependent dehydrogenase (short-subunit alcohol dehydrogenase family)